MKLIINAFFLILIVVSLSQCSSIQKLQKEAPVKIGAAYYQQWVSGIQGSSGINIYIPIEGVIKEGIRFDSVYFKGKASKLEFKPDSPSLFIGRFLSETNQKKDIVMSNKPNAEYGNELPKTKSKIPFELKENEGVVSYKEGDKTKYFKITNVVEKQSLYYPSAPPKKH